MCVKEVGEIGGPFCACITQSLLYAGIEEEVVPEITFDVAVNDILVHRGWCVEEVGELGDQEGIHYTVLGYAGGKLNHLSGIAGGPLLHPPLTILHAGRL